jgi:Thioredoxin domain
LVALTIRVLLSPGCGHGQKTLDMVREVVHRLASDAQIDTVEVNSVEGAERLRFRGSPTVLVNGVDIEPCPSGGIGFG